MYPSVDTAHESSGRHRTNPSTASPSSRASLRPAGNSSRHGLPSNHLALNTSDCEKNAIPEHQVAVTTSSGWACPSGSTAWGTARSESKPPIARPTSARFRRRRPPHGTAAAVLCCAVLCAAAAAALMCALCCCVVLCCCAVLLRLVLLCCAALCCAVSMCLRPGQQCAVCPSDCGEIQQHLNERRSFWRYNSVPPSRRARSKTIGQCCSNRLLVASLLMCCC